MINNIKLFECLCSEFGVKVSSSWTYQELGSLKDRLLTLAESEFPYYSTDAYLEDARKVFVEQKKPFTVSDLRNVHSGVFRDLYQMLCWGLKIRKLHTKQQEDDYIVKYLQIERENQAYRFDRSNPISRVARSLCRRTFSGLDLDANAIARWCRHGPGATYDGEVGSDKNWFVSPPTQLLKYASWDLFFANSSFAAENANVSLSHLENSKRSHEYEGGLVDRKRFIEARLTLVPKTFKGPRGVFISPKEAMFWQLAQDEALKRHVNKTWLRACYSPNSQDPSREMAYQASYSRWSATLDLSDASDRVPLSLVASLFHRATYLALARTRPCYVHLPDGRKVRLAMFGPMGDGKTFPILTIICIVLSVSAIIVAQNGEAAEPTAKLVERASRGVRVFGDDIIVPTEYYESVVEALQAHNLKVNVAKSFSKGGFRESCGMDAYNGACVTPIRQKVDLDSAAGRSDLSSLIDLHNSCVYRGFERLSVYLRAYITRKWHGKVGLTTDHTQNPHALLVRNKRAQESDCCLGCSTRLRDCTGTVEHRPERFCDYSRCMWCGSLGLISQLDSLHVHWRLNTDLHRLEQRTLVPEPIDYGFEGDSWWNLSYALFPKQQRYQLFSAERTVLGSKIEFTKWYAACREMGIGHIVSSGGGLRLRWVPLR